jgi:hypothetical protein
MTTDGKDEKDEEAKRATEFAKEERWFAENEKVGYSNPPAEHQFKKGDFR